MEIRNGLLKLIVNLLSIKDEPTIRTAVAAAPSVPSSPTSSTALWTTCGDAKHYPLESGEAGCEQGPESLWRLTFIHLLLVCHCTVNLFNLSVLPSDCQLVCCCDAWMWKVKLRVLRPGSERQTAGAPGPGSLSV